MTLQEIVNWIIDLFSHNTLLLTTDPTSSDTNSENENITKNNQNKSKKTPQFVILSKSDHKKEGK